MYYFLLLFLFFLLILILLSPVYTKKDIVPPLADTNFDITRPVGVFNPTNTELSTYVDLIISDNTIADGDADGDEILNDTDVSFIPNYSESHKRLTGYFEVNLSTDLARTLSSRVVDNNRAPSQFLSRYNYGWTAISTVANTNTSIPVYRAIVPFNIPGNSSDNHLLTLQISSSQALPEDTSTSVQISSVYLYYYAV